MQALRGPVVIYFCFLASFPGHVLCVHMRRNAASRGWSPPGDALPCHILDINSSIE